MSWFKKRGNAFTYAFSGLAQAWRKEPHLQIHIAATVLVVVSGLHFRIAPGEWVAVAICCALVIALELVNTAIEELCDLVTTEQNPAVRYIKDICSAAVLLACVAAAITGALIFGPRFF